jgi:glutathione S-transferase
MLLVGNANYSSWSLRAWLALAHSGLSAQLQRMPLYTADSAAQLAQLSPSGQVPVLYVGPQAIYDSLAIAEYLAEQAPLWPQDPLVRAAARSRVAEMHAGFQALRQHLPMNGRSYYRDFAVPAAAGAEIDRLTRYWEQDRHSYGADGPWLFGAWSLADAFYAPVVLRLRTYGVRLKGPAQDYADTLWSDPALQRWLMMAYDEPETLTRYESSGFKYEIHGWRPAYQQAFYELNAAWINRYFRLEPEDMAVLGDPEKHILRPGGRLLFALVEGAVVGTCALIPEGHGHYELAKMTVAEAFEGRGIGRRLCEAAVGIARGLGATQVDLISQRGLGRALHLYQQLGFREVPLTLADRERYQRCDIRMALPLKA